MLEDDGQPGSPWQKGGTSAYTYNLVLKADTIADKYKVNGWPTFYILDGQGKVLWSAVGHDPSHEEQMAKVIEEALK